MEIIKENVTKIIAGVAIIGSVIAGGFVVDRSIQEAEIKQMRVNLISKVHDKTISYDEYLRLIHEYNAEIKKGGGQMKLKNINKDNSIIQRMNQKIVE